MFKSNDKKSIEVIGNILTSILNSFTDESISSLAIKIHDAKLMNVQFPWIIRAVKFIRRFDDQTVARMVFNKSPDMAKQLILGTIDHLKNGEDQTNQKNVGGFNQKEIDDLISILNPYVIELSKAKS